MISICIATYNGSAYIQEQLQSILSQISDVDEIVIADDCSSDDTVQKINFFNDSRIKWVKSCSQLGVIKNFERTLYAAKGDYIFLCDQDDVWLPGKVSQCVAALQMHILVVTDCRVVDQTLSEISPSFFALRYSGKGILKNIWKNSYLGCCMAFRRELLSLSLPIPEKIPMHDMWLGLLAETQGPVLFMPKTLSLYRRHHLAVSPTAGNSNLSIYQKFYVRIILIIYFFKRICCYTLINKVKSIQ